MTRRSTIQNNSARCICQGILPQTKLTKSTIGLTYPTMGRLLKEPRNALRGKTMSSSTKEKRTKKHTHRIPSKVRDEEQRSQLDNFLDEIRLPSQHVCNNAPATPSNTSRKSRANISQTLLGIKNMHT